MRLRREDNDGVTQLAGYRYWLRSLVLTSAPAYSPDQPENVLTKQPSDDTARMPLPPDPQRATLSQSLWQTMDAMALPPAIAESGFALDDTEIGRAWRSVRL